MAYSELRKIAFVGNYLTQKFGIATFQSSEPASLEALQKRVETPSIIHA